MRRSASTRFTGLVIKRPFAVGSKSEHMAVCLVDDSGRSRKLRRVGGHPFQDARLEQLVGKRISGEGRIVAGNTVILTQWSETADGDSDAAPPPTLPNDQRTG